MSDDTIRNEMRQQALRAMDKTLDSRQREQARQQVIRYARQLSDPDDLEQRLAALPLATDDHDPADPYWMG